MLSSDILEDCIEAFLREDYKHLCECEQILLRTYEGTRNEFYAWLAWAWGEFAQNYDRQAASARKNQRKRLLNRAARLRQQADRYIRHAGFTYQPVMATA